MLERPIERDLGKQKTAGKASTKMGDPLPAAKEARRPNTAGG